MFKKFIAKIVEQKLKEILENPIVIKKISDSVFCTMNANVLNENEQYLKDNYRKR